MNVARGWLWAARALAGSMGAGGTGMNMDRRQVLVGAIAVTEHSGDSHNDGIYNRAVASMVVQIQHSVGV
jgi:hypothetical protein